MIKGNSTIDRLSQWIHQSNISRNVFACYFVPWMFLTSYRPIGRQIYNYDWDLVIVLDACRVDAIREVQHEYDFLENIDHAFSVGSSSKEWIINTFHKQHSNKISDTSYITANGWVDSVLVENVNFAGWTVLNGSVADSNRLVHKLLQRPLATKGDFEKVWTQPLREIRGIKSFPANELTDYAIKCGRMNNPNRMIVHYMQPHAPYLQRAANGDDPLDIDKNPFELLQEGHKPKPIKRAYINNLRYVLDSVDRLINNYNAEKVIITADHGELFGEAMLYGHAEGILHPKLRYVPWVTTSGVDTESSHPDIDLETESTTDVDDRLAALGYK